MSKVIWHVTMSLDGFITGRDDSMDWAFEYDEPSPIADEVVRTTGAIIAGRRWYEVATSRYKGVESIYGGNWSGPVFVLTHLPPDASEDPSVTFLTKALTTPSQRLSPQRRATASESSARTPPSNASRRTS